MSKGKYKMLGLAAALVLLPALILLSGCGLGSGVPTDTGGSGLATDAESKTSPTPDSEATAKATASAATDFQTEAPPAGATEEELRAYYEELIATLRQDLLSERLDRYLSDYDYETRLAQLEQELALLQAGAELESIQSVGGLPVNPPEQADTEQATASAGTDRPAGAGAESNTYPEPSESATVAFRYGIVDGAAVIYEYLGNSRTVSVPGAIDGYPVTTIADCAFQNSRVTSVILPDSVTSVGWFAFANCASLESVTLPASVTAIAYAAFDGCPSLTVLCTKDSYAARWAASYGLPVQYL
jgi:hypothetical protein